MYYQEYFCRSVIRIISLPESASCERGCSRLALLSPARRVAVGMPGSCPNVKEGTWCFGLCQVPGWAIQHKAVCAPAWRGLLGLYETAEVEEKPY